MLVALLVSLLVALVAYLYGRAALAALAPLPPFAVVALVGLALLSAGAGVWALFGPLRAGALGVVLVGAAALAVARPRWVLDGLAREAAELRDAGPLAWAVLLLGALFVLARTAGPVEHYDSGTYYAPIIRWLEEAGFVPGLGNLHGRYALSAGWFVLSALFSFVWLGGRSLHVLNGTLLLLLFLWGVTALAAWRRGERRASLLLRLALPLLGLRLFGKFLSSPTPDVAVAALVWVVGALALELAECAEGEASRVSPEPRALAVALLAAFAVTVKLSALPLLLLPLLMAIARFASGRARQGTVLLAAVAAMLAPTVAQSIVTSGYPVFPLPHLDPFDFDWELPHREVAAYVRWIESWARLPNHPAEAVLAMPLAEWLPRWWEELRWPFSGMVAAVALLAPLRLAAAVARRAVGLPLDRPPSRLRAALHATAWAGAILWFTKAPATRFGWGFVGLLLLLLALPWLTPALRRLPAASLAALLLAALLWEAWQVHGWEPEAFPDAAQHALVPADYPVMPVRAVRLDGLLVRVPIENDQCWHEPFPCTSTPDPRLQLRGRTLREGFRIVK